MRLRLLILAALTASASLFSSPAVASTARLSWSATDSLVTDLTNPGASNNLYVWYNDVYGFAGGEIDIVWEPAGTGFACFDRFNTIYKTSTTCTYLNRGSVVPAVTVDDPDHYHVVWANNVATTCTVGVGLVLQFGFGDCPTTSGCFQLTYAYAGLCPPGISPSPGRGYVPLCHSDDPPTVITGAIASVRGGGGHYCGPADRLPAAWGAIKALYRN